MGKFTKKIAAKGLVKHGAAWIIDERVNFAGCDADRLGVRDKLHRELGIWRQKIACCHSRAENFTVSHQWAKGSNALFFVTMIRMTIRPPWSLQ